MLELLQAARERRDHPDLLRRVLPGREDCRVRRAGGKGLFVKAQEIEVLGAALERFARAGEHLRLQPAELLEDGPVEPVALPPREVAVLGRQRGQVVDAAEQPAGAPLVDHVGQPLFRGLVEVNGERIIVDVKTTASSASKSEFERTIWNFGYGVQCAFYLEMARACGVPSQHFVFVVVEKTAPYATAVYRFSDEIAEAFRPRMLELVAQYKAYLAEGPRGYEGVTEIGIPAWAAARIAQNLGEFNEV